MLEMLSFVLHIFLTPSQKVYPCVEIILGKYSILSLKYFCLILQLYEHLIYKSFCFTVPQKYKAQRLLLREYASHKQLLVILSPNTSPVQPSMPWLHEK